jgi:hypothetical protein
MNFVTVHGTFVPESYLFNPRSGVLKKYFTEKWPRGECGFPKSLTRYLETFTLSNVP